MTNSNPLLPQIFKILAKQGWVAVSEEKPNLLRKRNGNFSDGFRVVTDKAVETLGVIPMAKTPHIQFITQNARHLF